MSVCLLFLFSFFLQRKTEKKKENKSRFRRKKEKKYCKNRFQKQNSPKAKLTSILGLLLKKQCWGVSECIEVRVCVSECVSDLRLLSCGAKAITATTIKAATQIPINIQYTTSIIQHWMLYILYKNSKNNNRSSSSVHMSCGFCCF